MDRPTDPPAPLALNAVSAGYESDRSLVLDGASLELPPGTITGLLGRNGSGKTTLVRVALGLMRARTGTAKLFGADSWDSPAEVRKRLGYVSQEFASFGWMTVDACLAMIGAHYEDWDQTLIDGLKRDWRLENRKIGKLSPGDQQKVAILLAVGHKPDLLLLDEPAASLDPAARRDFLKALVELNADRGQTVLLSSHITSDIERVASHIAILHGGRIVCHEALDDIKERVGLVTLTGSPWPPMEKILTSHGNRYWLWNPDECGLAADVRVDDVVLEDLFVGITAR